MRRQHGPAIDASVPAIRGRRALQVGLVQVLGLAEHQVALEIRVELFGLRPILDHPRAESARRRAAAATLSSSRLYASRAELPIDAPWYRPHRIRTTLSGCTVGRRRRRRGLRRGAARQSASGDAGVTGGDLARAPRPAAPSWVEVIAIAAVADRQREHARAPRSGRWPRRRRAAPPPSAASSRRLTPARPDSPIITSFSSVSTKYALPGPAGPSTASPRRSCGRCCRAAGRSACRPACRW